MIEYKKLGGLNMVLKKIKENRLDEITILEVYNLRKIDIIEILDFKEVEYKKSLKKDDLLKLTELLSLIEPLVEKRNKFLKETHEKEKKEQERLDKLPNKVINIELENEIKGTIIVEIRGEKITRSIRRLYDWYNSIKTNLHIFSYGGKNYIICEKTKKFI